MKKISMVFLISFAVFSAILCVGLVPDILTNERGQLCELMFYLEGFLSLCIVILYIPLEKRFTAMLGLTSMTYNLTCFASALVLSAFSFSMINHWTSLIERSDESVPFANFMLGLGVVVAFLLLVAGFVLTMIIRLIYQLICDYMLKHKNT